MSTKRKALIIILGIEAVVIVAVIVFLLYMNSDTVKANRQLELAQRYLLEEDYEEAIAAFEAAIEIDPKNEEAYLGLAEAYMAVDDVEKAVKILERGSRRIDSEEIFEALEIHKTEIESKELAARKAAADAAAAQAAVDALQIPSTEETNEIPLARPYEPAEVTTGFVMQDGEICYYDEHGKLVIGWFEVENNRYCARDDGILYKDGEYEVDGTKCIFDYNGIYLEEVRDENVVYDSADIFSTWRNYVSIMNETSVYFLPADYDGDGTEEAFAITGTFDGEMMYNNAKIYFINAKGNVSCVCEQTYGGEPLYGYLHEGVTNNYFSTHTNNDYLLKAATSKFIVWEVSAYGSGSISIILGVKDGMAYEPDISNHYMDFGVNDANQFVGYSSDFSKGFHDYIEHIFIFDENLGQFILQ